VSGIFASLFEPRFHVKQEPPGWVEKFFGWKVASGVQVNQESALTYSAVFACIRILAETVAVLPLHVYRKLPGGGKEKATEHTLSGILHTDPNDEMTSFHVRETLQGHLASWGNCYAYMDWARSGYLRALWPLRPDRMSVKRENGRLKYIYRLQKPDRKGRTERVWGSERVLHIPGMGFDGVIGYSPIRMARQSIGLALAAEEFGSRFFGNDARPGVVLEHPGQLGSEAHNNLKDSYEEEHGGLTKSHKPLILEEGMTLKEVGIPPEDAQFLQTRKFQIAEVARWYNMPLHKLREMDRQTHNNIEHEGIEFVVYTMMPWLVRWEQVLTKRLLTPRERQQLYIKFNVMGLLRGDMKSRHEAYAIGRNWGWLSADDVRELEDDNPLPDGQGQIYYMPLNMVPADQAASGFSQNPSNSRAIQARSTPSDGFEERSINAARYRRRLMAAQLPIFQDVTARWLRRERNDVGNKARQLLKERSIQEFTLWLQEFYQEHARFISQQMWPVVRTYAELVAGAAYEEVGESYEEIPDELERFARSYANTLGSRHAIRSEERVRAVLQDALDTNEDPEDAITSEMESWPEDRAEDIAQEESSRANNAIAVTAYSLLGVMYLVSRAIGDSCPYCLDLDGTRIGINEFFLQAGVNFQPEGAETPLTVKQSKRHPPYHSGCDCVATAGF